ncbi:MAG TPA: ELM1/GtrOC1 family putative glycosyltransferase [Methylomirabilota bacterium]|nr:ELM1/GtrOC1 family putative glycosyltransferase [Methylomirabilota bacterium]
MRVLVLLDKKTGHAHQAEALALAIASLTDVEIERIPAKPGRLGHNRLLAALSRRRDIDPARWLKRLYGIDAAALARPGAIVSSGRPTVAAGIFLARIFGAPFIYAGRITGFDLADVALQLVASPRYAHEPKAAFAPIPTRVDAAALPPPRPLDTPGDLAGASLALLVGGDAPGYRYAERDWSALVALVRDTAARHGVRWRVATSRRSPENWAGPFAAMAADGTIDAFVDYRSAGPGSADRLHDADALVVTEDSLSMMAEALATLRPVVALKPAAVAPGFATEVVAAMAAGGAMAVMPMATTSAGSLAAALIAAAPERENPRDRIARVLKPVLNLP